MDEEQSRPDGTELESEDASPNIVDLAAIRAERLGIPHRALPVRDSGVRRIDIGPIIGTDGAVSESAVAAQLVGPHDRGALSTRAGARRTSQDAGTHCADCGRLALAGRLTLGELHVGRERQLNARRVEMLDSWPLRVYCESCADERDLSRIAIALRSALATHGPEPLVAVPGDEQGPSYSCPHEVALGTPYTSISVRYELVERPQLELGPEDAVWVMPITMLESWAVSYCEPCASWIDFDRVEIPRRPRDGDGVGSRQPTGHPGQPEAGRDPALPVPSDTASEVSDA